VESSFSSIIFDDVEEHDGEDSFFCRETDTITKDTRTAHGQKLTQLIVMNATNERMVKKTEMNIQAQKFSGSRVLMNSLTTSTIRIDS